MPEFQFRKLRRSQLLAENSTTRQLDRWPEATRRRFGRFSAYRKVGPLPSATTAPLPTMNPKPPPSSPIPQSPSLGPFLDRLLLFPSFAIFFFLLFSKLITFLLFEKRSIYSFKLIREKGIITQS